MLKTTNNTISNNYLFEEFDYNTLSKTSNQIKANIAVTLLKHRLKNYLNEIT